MKLDTSTWTLIFDIIRAGLDHRIEDVVQTAHELAAQIEHPSAGAGDPRIAHRLRGIVAGSPPSGMRPSRASAASPITGGTSASVPRAASIRPNGAHGTSVTNGASGTFVAFADGSGPVDSESRSPFVDELMVPPTDPPILPEMAFAELERFVTLQQRRDELVNAGLPAPRALLLYGAPGCGKTTAAQYVARALALPLLTVRLDAVISSYLGTSAKNLRTVFEYAAHRGGVLFLDEFDALAKMRDDANEVGEIKRIVNGLIQHLDAYPDMPLIAATNHDHLLDPAIWRRFDSVIQLPLPGLAEREALLRRFSYRAYTVPPSTAIERRGRELGTTDRRPLRAASVTAPPDASSQQPASVAHAMRPNASAAFLDEEEFSVLAQLSETCSGADLERFVLRARQDALLGRLEATPDRPDSVAAQIALEIWRAREPEGAARSLEQTSADLRPAWVHFIDQQTRGRPSARVVSALTGIPPSTIARIRQQRGRGTTERPMELGEEEPYDD